MSTQHYRTCSLCEAMCGVMVESEAGQVVRIAGDRADPFSRGHICPKAMALADLHHDPDRLRTPLRRHPSEPERFVPIGWDEAFDEVAAQLKRVQRAHGRDAVALYQGNPTVHNMGALLLSPLFTQLLGTRNRFSATSVDQLPHMLAAYLMFGHQLLMPVPDLDRTQYMLVIGANPAVSNGSLMSAPGAAQRLEAIVARGGKVVVIDPRRSETARLASEHHFIRPGSDVFFLLAVLHTLFADGAIKLGALSDLSRGVDVLCELVKPYAPERVAARTGIAAADILRIARELARSERAVCYGRVGVSMQDFGALCCWLINVINLVTGNLDRIGGAMFTQPAVDPLGLDLPLLRGRFGSYHSRVRKLPEFSGELPVAVLAEEIETPGPGQIRALITAAGNPVLSAPNGARLSQAFAGLDFMVSIDFYLNETTRHAHIILPPTGPLEHDHYDVALHLLAVRNSAKYATATFERPVEARHDFEIFNALIARLGDKPHERWLARQASRLLAGLGAAGILDLLLRAGPYGAGFWPGKPGLSLATLKAAPHGIDLGALSPCLRQRLPKDHARIELAPEPMQRDLQRVARALGAAAEAGLVLIGRRQLRSNNSWLHNSPRMIKGPARCTLQMHPDDAEARGLRHGAEVQVRSKVGAVRVPLEVTDCVMQGVVSLPHGFGHTRSGTQLRVASAHAGASINDVTDEMRVDLLSGNASFSGVPVAVEAS
jgi:anaerobic selenocysteine-containing dehydrogenase